MGAPYSLGFASARCGGGGVGNEPARCGEALPGRRCDGDPLDRPCEADGSPAALPMGGKKPFRLAAQGDWIRARLAAKPDITGRELLAELRERKVEVSYYGVWHFLDRAGLSYKKNTARQRARSP